MSVESGVFVCHARYIVCVFVAWCFFIVWVTRVDMRVCARMSMRRCVRVVSAVLGGGVAV